jgi:hypothetical protein
MTSDARAVTEYRIPAVELKAGDLVNTSPGEDDWQQVLSVHTTDDGVTDKDLGGLIRSVSGRYLVVRLTDLAPVDSGVYFAGGLAMSYGTEGADQAVKDLISHEDGERIYLYTKFETVTVRS